MHRQPARTRKDAEALTPEAVRRIVLSLFRRRHDYGAFDLDELVAQLALLGVTTRKQLRLLMKARRRALLDSENQRMRRAELRWLATDGIEGLDMHAGKSFFAIPGLVRQAAELEFGERAEVLWTVDETG